MTSRRHGHRFDEGLLVLVAGRVRRRAAVALPLQARFSWDQALYASQFSSSVPTMPLAVAFAVLSLIRPTDSVWVAVSLLDAAALVRLLPYRSGYAYVYVPPRHPALIARPPAVPCTAACGRSGRSR